jgi:hypothetical protein
MIEQNTPQKKWAKPSIVAASEEVFKLMFEL